MLYSTLSFHRLTFLIAFAFALYHGTCPVHAAVVPCRGTDVVEDTKPKAKTNFDVHPYGPPPNDANSENFYPIEDMVALAIGPLLSLDRFSERPNTDTHPGISYPSREDDDQDADVYLERELSDLEAKKPMDDLKGEEQADDDMPPDESVITDDMVQEEPIHYLEGEDDPTGDEYFSLDMPSEDLLSDYLDRMDV